MDNTPIYLNDPSKSNPFYGVPKLPGESDDDYHRRLSQMAGDKISVNKLADSEEAKSRAILGEQEGVQSSRLGELTSLLAKQQDTAFNRQIPEIANKAQGQGFLETSGFGNALAREYKNLTADTSTELAKQSLADRDLQVKSLGDIGTNANNLSTAGLQRTFSTTDQAQADALAKQLAALGVPAPAKEPSTFDKALQYAGPILGGVGAVKGA